MKQTASAKPEPETLSKGERRRQQILEATLTVIAEQGLRGATHRAIASQAGIQLSLTTYYFKDIGELIEAAFTHFCESARPGYESLWQEINEEIQRFSKAELRSKTTRLELCEQLSRMASQYLMQQVKDKPVGLAVEQCLFTETRLSSALQVLADNHRSNLLKPLQAFCAMFNRQDPEVDAELLLDSLSQLECQSLNRVHSPLQQQQVHRLIRRQLGWVMGLPRA